MYDFCSATRVNFILNVFPRRNDSASRFRVRAACLGPATTPLDYRTNTQLEHLGHFSPRSPALNRFDPTLTQIRGIRLGIDLAPLRIKISRFAHAGAPGNPPDSMTPGNALGCKLLPPVILFSSCSLNSIVTRLAGLVGCHAFSWLVGFAALAKFASFFGWRFRFGHHSLLNSDLGSAYSDPPALRYPARGAFIKRCGAFIRR